MTKHDPTKTIRCACGKLATVRLKRAKVPSKFCCATMACRGAALRSFDDVKGPVYPPILTSVNAAGFTLSGMARTWR